MKNKPLDVFLGLVALLCGVAIAYVDSRPQWDDTGVTAGTIFLLCAVLAFFSPGRWWIWMLAVGLWVPVLALLQTGNCAAFLALLVAGMGSLLGRAIGMFYLAKPMPRT